MLGGPGGTLEDDFDTVALNVQCKVDHPLCSIVQPYPEFELNDITRNMSIAVAKLDEFPSQFNRSASIDIPDKAASRTSTSGSRSSCATPPSCRSRAGRCASAGSPSRCW